MNSTSLLSAMQKKVVVNEVRTPTNTWSGLGFSKSMPESAIKELVSGIRVSEFFRFEKCKYCPGKDCS